MKKLTKEEFYHEWAKLIDAENEGVGAMCLRCESSLTGEQFEACICSKCGFVGEAFIILTGIRLKDKHNKPYKNFYDLYKNWFESFS